MHLKKVRKDLFCVHILPTNCSLWGPCCWCPVAFPCCTSGWTNVRLTGSACMYIYRYTPSRILDSFFSNVISGWWYTELRSLLRRMRMNVCDTTTATTPWLQNRAKLLACFCDTPTSPTSATVKTDNFENNLERWEMSANYMYGPIKCVFLFFFQLITKSYLNIPDLCSFLNPNI